MQKKKRGPSFDDTVHLATIDDYLSIGAFDGQLGEIGVVTQRMRPEDRERLSSMERELKQPRKTYPLLIDTDYLCLDRLSEGHVTVHSEGVHTSEHLFDLAFGWKLDPLRTSTIYSIPILAQRDAHLSDFLLEWNADAFQMPYLFQFFFRDCEATHLVQLSPQGGAEIVHAKTLSKRIVQNYIEPQNQHNYQHMITHLRSYL